MKTIKAWAVVDKDGDIVSAPSSYSPDLIVCKSAERCDEWKVNRRDERVVRVTIQVEDE